MADQLEHALMVAEIAELQKQQSEARITALYVGLTAEERGAWVKRDDRIASLRGQLEALDADRQVLLRGAPPRPFVVTLKRGSS